MPIKKNGRAVWATVNADICMCGHRVDAHASSEFCRYKTKGGAAACGCISIRVER